MKATRREFLGTLAALSYAGMSAAARAADGARPNILFIFSDDHTPQAIGAYPTWLQDYVKANKITPNIDRIAEEGGLFLNSFCCNSICGPSRAAILTGKHSHANGYLANSPHIGGNSFDSSQWAFPKQMQEAGYQTAIVGKWHLGSEPVGFDYWKVLPGQGHYYNPDFKTPDGMERIEGYTTNIISDLSLEWIKERESNKPFMLMSQHKAPHREWSPDTKYINFLDDADAPEPPNLFDDYAHRADPAAKQEMTIAHHMRPEEDLKLTKPLTELEAEEEPGMWRRMTPEQQQAWDAGYAKKNQAFFDNPPEGKDLVRWRYQRYIKDYLRTIKSVDDAVGKLLAYLDEAGLAENTIVIYCADQGFYLGEHGWYDKRWMYEESLMMPFIIRWPGKVKPGTTYDPMIQNIDYAPTFLAMAGIEAPDEVQGRNFLPILEGDVPEDWRDSIYYHYYEYPAVHMVERHRGVRDRRYKLIHYYALEQWELFDLERDPHEMHSVYDNPIYSDVVERLKKELVRLEEQYDLPPLEKLKAEAIELKERLGEG